VDDVAPLDLKEVSHRPFPPPSRFPLLRMAWKEMVYLHWRVEPGWMQERVPESLEVEVLDGSAWLSVVAFRMVGTRLSVGLPVAWWDFPEVNVRTYVRQDGVPGLRFLALHAADRATVAAGKVLGFPYRHGRIRLAPIQVTDRVRGEPPLEFTWVPGAPRAATPLDSQLVDRFVAFGGADGRGRQLHVHHAPVPLRDAVAQVVRGGTLPREVWRRPPDLVHASLGCEVAAWIR